MRKIEDNVEVWSLLNGIFAHYPEVISLKSEEGVEDAHIDFHLVRDSDGSIQHLRNGMVESTYKEG